MYKTESTLGLIGSILSAVCASLVFLFSIVFTLLLRWSTVAGSRLLRFFGPVIETGGAVIGAVAVIAVVFGLAVLITAAVLGFLGTSMIKRENRRGGILLVIAGGLMLIPPYLGAGVFGTAISILFFIAGIMALTKRPSHA